jgi:hypothetical protein
MIILSNLNKMQEKVFDIFVIISYILIVASFLGLSTSAEYLLYNIDYYVKIYICLFLIWRFNPLRSKYEFTNLDRKITFTSGMFILTTGILANYIPKVKTQLQTYKSTILNLFSR